MDGAKSASAHGCALARPLVEAILPYFYKHGAQRPEGQIKWRTALLVTFAAVGKSDSKRQGLASKHGMDAKPKR